MATRESAAIRERKKSSEAKEIGPGWAVKNIARRRAGLKSLRKFLKSYFPWAFPLPWSPDHLRIIECIEDAARGGGLFAFAMPRGSGKTTICERAAIWAILGGLHRFVCVVGATEKRASKILENIKTELRLNDILAEDFPEVCHPVRALNNEGRRCKGQTWNGQLTEIGWGQAELDFPRVPDGVQSLCQQATISVRGITATDLRGQNKTLQTGEVIRPTFALIDDPQDRESANSESQCITREEIIVGDVLYMAGPGEKMSAVMPCTVIRKGDMADRLLNSEKHPDWNGVRTKMLYGLPDQKAIDAYADVRSEALRGERPRADINRHWKAHRVELESGCTVGWKERKNKDEVSAVQHAVNLLLRNRGAFFAEYQNEPLEESLNAEKLITADEICEKLSNVERGRVAQEWHHVTSFIDVQSEALFWCVCAWGDNFSGGVIDYGCFPDQGRTNFIYGSGEGLSASMSRRFPGKPKEAVVFAGLEELTRTLCAREWLKPDGTPLRIEKLLIDSGDETATVYQFCRWTPHAAIVAPTKGIPITAGKKPMNEYRPEPGMGKPGLNWRPSAVQGKRLFLIDVNFWKSFVFTRLATARGAAGCLELFGSDPNKHRMFATHLHAEYTVKTFGYGRSVTEWKRKPVSEFPDNHWFDCLVGCAVGASMVGVKAPGDAEEPSREAPRLRLSDLQKQKRSAVK